MTLAVSQGAAIVYGVQRVCAAFDIARSSFYAWRAGEALEGPREPRGKRGPKARLSDAELLIEIRDDLAASPFKGEGHRKVWARLRVLRHVRVSRKRVLRLMRENRLLSPYRVPKAPPHKHDGTIMTDAPNVMWGTDGARVFTLKDGWVWIFSVS